MIPGDAHLWIRIPLVSYYDRIIALTIEGSHVRPDVVGFGMQNYANSEAVRYDRQFVRRAPFFGGRETVQ